MHDFIIKELMNQPMKYENENCNISIPEGNSYRDLKRSAKGPCFKVSSERLSPEIDIQMRPIIPKLTQLNVA